MSGAITRRAFVLGLLAAGLSVGTAGALLSSATRAAAEPGCTALDPNVSGEIRFLTGPFTDREMEVQETIAAAFNAKYPNVTFSFTLFDWYTSPTDIQTSLLDGAHDLYYLGEADAMLFGAEDTNFLDIGPYANASCFAEEKANYHALERLWKLTPKPTALPFLWFQESGLFVNLDKVKSVGFDETFVDSWDSFAAALLAMTDPAKDEYGIALDAHPWVEWYGRMRSAGGSYLDADRTGPAVNTPQVVQGTQDMVDLFLKDKSSAPLGKYDYTTAQDAFAAGKIAAFGMDSSVAAAMMRRDLPFEWIMKPWPPGPVARHSVLNTGSYAIGKKTPNPDLAWEVLKFWTSGEQGAFYSGTASNYPSNETAYDPAYGWQELAAPQLIAVRPELEEQGVWMEEFTEFGLVNNRAYPQIQRAYTGEISAEEAVKNVEAIVKEVMGF
jgi:ABC-type glycerol-3-phosphate transport system substrate-binding protein